MQAIYAYGDTIVSGLTMGKVSHKTVRIGVSACLVGHEVRYDGSHRKHAWLTDVLGRILAGRGCDLAWVPVCPEVELGLGVPRETIQLVRHAPGQSRLIASRSGRDLTDAMRLYAAQKIAALASEGLSGYVLKSKSPSCGLSQVEVFAAFGDDIAIATRGRGLFAEALRARFPRLPIVEEHDLDTPRARADFVARLCAYRA